MADIWEYECPQFVDFTSTLSDHEDDDSWFEVDHEAKVPTENSEIHKTKKSSSDTECSTVNPKDPVIEETKHDVDQMSLIDSSSNRPPLNNRSNILTKEEFYKNRQNENVGKSHIGKENAKNGPRRVLRKCWKTDSSEHSSNLLKNSVQPEESKPTVGKVPPRPYKHRRSLSAGNLTEPKEKHQHISYQNKKNNLQKCNSLKKLNNRMSNSVDGLNLRKSVSTDKINSKSSSLRKPNHTRTNSTSSINSEKSDATDASSKSSGIPKIRSNLVPSAYRAFNSSHRMTTDDLELQKIEKKREEALAVKKLSEKSLKISLHSKSYVPMNSSRKLTVEKGFEFQSDKRLRTRSADYAKSPVTNFAQILRKEDSNHCKKPLKKTVVQPFKLSKSKEVEPPVGKFQTVAEQVRNFSKKTPERFRTRSKDNKPQRPWSPPRLTRPKTPNFSSYQRSRPLNILSTKEMEEKELEEIQKYKFKAKEVDKKIFKTRTGIKEVPKREVTIPVPFDLPGSKLPTTKVEVEEENYVFHARPLPTDILERVVGVKPVEVHAPTVPESPAFALKQRMQRFIPHEPTQEPLVQKIKARPYVHSGIKFEPKFEHRSTVAEPFTFDERMKESQTKKEQKIQKMIEESSKIAEFTATPIPDYSNTGLPPKKMTTVTKLVPFKLHIEERVEKRIEEKQHQLEEEKRLQEEKMQFKAQSCEILNKPPFVPHLEHKCTQEHNEFQLFTETRSAHRIQFEEQKKAREAELLAMRQEAERLQQEEEERRIQKLRKDAVHKANPVKHYKPVEIQHKALSVTIPITPKLATQNRLRNNESATYEM